MKKDLKKIQLNTTTNVGDIVKIEISFSEGNKERTQFVRGTIISQKNLGYNTTITLREIMQGVGVERVYLLHSPKIKNIQIVQHSKVRRAKLYYLRSKTGKAARVKRKIK